MRKVVQRALVADSFHPADQITPRTLSEAAQAMRAPSPVSDLCSCGMARRNEPHLCIVWHPNLMVGDAPRDLTATIRKYVPKEDRLPIVTVNERAQVTVDYLRGLLGVVNGARLVRWNVDADQTILRDDRGRRIRITEGTPDAYGITELTLTVEDDPEWEREFVRKRTVERSAYAMPTCCDRPDPKIAKSGRPFCANCKRYLDKVPKPVEGPQLPVPSQ